MLVACQIDGDAKRFRSFLTRYKSPIASFSLPKSNGSEIDFDDDYDGELVNGYDIVSPEFMPPEVTYWSPAARKQRANKATSLRMTKYRKKSSNAQS